MHGVRPTAQPGWLLGTSTLVSLTRAFVLAIVAGVLVGLTVGAGRAAGNAEDVQGRRSVGSSGGDRGGLSVRAGVGFGGVLYFLLGPLLPADLLKFTVLALSLLGLVGLIS